MGTTGVAERYCGSTGRQPSTGCPLGLRNSPASHAGLTDADVAAWAERLRFPNLKVVSFAFNDLTLACVVDLKKIQLQSPRLTQFLLPPNILVALIQASAVKKAEERANNP